MDSPLGGHGAGVADEAEGQQHEAGHGKDDDGPAPQALHQPPAGRLPRQRHHQPQHEERHRIVRPAVHWKSKNGSMPEAACWLSCMASSACALLLRMTCCQQHEI